jgi:hypothetical protein
MSDPAPVFVYLKQKVLRPVEFELIGRNREGNFSIQRSCGSNRNLDSYHMSVPQLRQCGSGPVDTLTRKTPYSIKLPRDRAVLPVATNIITGPALERYACGLDISFPSRKLQSFSKALIELVQADVPYARDVCEVVYSPDGKTVYGWWAGNGRDSKPELGYGDGSHLWHTHISQHRDAAENIPATAELVIRALHRGGLISEEDMDGYLEPFKPEEPVNDADTLLVQRNLNAAGLANPPLVEDGQMGPVTRGAIAGIPAAVAAKEQAAASTTKDETKEVEAI